MADSPAFDTTLDDAVAPLVLGIDVGSTASRAGLYDARGLPVRGHKHKVPHAFTTAADGTSTIDADQVADEVGQCIDRISARLDRGSVAGVAMDTFAATLVGVGSDGRALMPCITYADTRDLPQLDELLRTLDRDEVHDRTGTRLHTSYLAPRLLWVEQNSPEVFAATRHWMSLGEYVELRLTGATASSTSGAAWSGLLDRRTGAWVPELLSAAHVSAEQLGSIVDPDEPIPGADAGSRWPALAGASWCASVPDGVAANIGAGAADEHTVGLSMATSGAMRVLVHGSPATLPSGLWCYRVSRERSIVGGAINDVGRAVTWIQANLALGEGLSLEDVARRDPAAGTPVVLPFLSGERATGWRGDARAAWTGVSAATDGAGMARGMLEGVAVTYARVGEQLREANPQAEWVIASGRVAEALPGLLPLVADALGMPVQRATLSRSTLHGTVLLALESLAPSVTRTPVPMADGATPDPAHAEHVAAYRAGFERLYAQLLR